MLAAITERTAAPPRGCHGCHGRAPGFHHGRLALALCVHPCGHGTREWRLCLLAGGPALDSQLRGVVSAPESGELEFRAEGAFGGGAGAGGEELGAGAERGGEGPGFGGVESRLPGSACGGGG